ncbi:GNAT family N-acetyltransferase [Macrococcus armenti]|uniref:GNAT family N-acetyltransferase n=1 Tax=Macrococcus armenti TaxID=2875764 RepID=A0ABY3ZX98_9STAP|nr:GNAT family N-acetyltransferase [Macrococcus armenti]UOB20979.1 GNAT family N-acetyltransferase [Macrococcus armenti]
MHEIFYDNPLIETIARIHEHIPKSFDSSYKTSQLDVALRTESIRLLMQHNKDRIFIIEESELIAFIWFNMSEKTHIKSLYVSQGYRKRGIAVQLKQFVEQLSLQNGIHYIYGDVHEKNKSMRYVNEKLGYKSNNNRMYKILEVPND